MRKKLTEKYLLYQIQVKQNSDSFGTLYDQYIEKIYRFVYLKLSSKEEAEDLTSEVFLKTWNYLIEHPQEEISSFSGLVYKIARNAVIDVYRSRARKKTTFIDNLDDFPADATYIDAIHMNQEIQALLRQIKRMKNEYQEVLVLRYIDDLSMKEIAEILGKTSSNVRVTLHRALKVLKKLSETNE